MKNRSLLIISLLFALTVGNTNAHNAPQHPQNHRDGELLVQGFENGMGDWTFQNEQGNYGIINTTFSHTGQNSFRMKSAAYAYGYLISPELPETENGVNVEFYYAIRTAAPTEFRVGYSMATNDPYDFFWSDLIYVDVDMVGEWQQYVTNFPPNVKYIAIAKPTTGGFLFVDDFVFTYADCAMPTVPEAVSTSQSIALSWTGNSSYDLRYAPFHTYDFAEGLGDWTPSFGNNSWEWDFTTDHSHYGAGSAISDVNVSHHHNYLVSPLLTFGGHITFFASGICIAGQEFKGQNRASAQYNFKVMIATGETPTLNDFTQVGGVITVEEGVWKKYTIDLSGYSGTGHIAICHIYNAKGQTEPDQYKLAIDDITVYYPWVLIEDLQATNYTIENTDPATYYAIQLKGGCNQWTYTLNVMTPPTTLPDVYEFVQAGNWNVAENWKNWLMPPVDGDVIIRARAKIPAGYVAEVGEVTMDSTGELIIADGGQLKHSGTGVKATMEKYITGYTNEKDHYYLLAFPTNNDIPIGYNNFKNLVASLGVDVVYDLYEFDQNEDLEWINYEPVPDPTPGVIAPHPFISIRNGKGYLYARDQSAKLEFVTTATTITSGNYLKPSNIDVTLPLAYTAGAEFAGWNLVGNPFACNAYLTDNRQFYRLEETENGSRIVLATDMVIAPMEGVFVQATSTSEYATFTSTEPRNNDNSLIDFTLRKANMRTKTNIDRTRVVFGEGSNMSHLDLMADPNRLYFPIDNKAMTVVYAQPVGELPLNFEVATEGTFVLNFECRAEDLVYCHLIDNLTGADIDLLQTPEYSFDSRLTDYASRFRVLFAKAEGTNNVTNEDFAYIFNDNLIIANEGHATLQVIDLQGRIIKSETIDGNAYTAINVVPGVYLLRLVNGNDVKVQKIVVR